MISKAKLDKAGRNLSDPKREYDDEMLAFEIMFDDYRKAHLEV